MDYVKRNLKDEYGDSKKSHSKFMTEKESAEYGVATIGTLIIAILLSFLPVIEFNQIMLFLILTEIIAVKDTLRKGLTRIN